MKVEDIGNGWTRLSITGTFPMHRTGWRGVWDALKAAVTGEKRHTVPVELIFSAYTKGEVFLTWGGQLTEREIDQ